MPAPLSRDLRERIDRAVEGGSTMRQAFCALDRSITQLCSINVLGTNDYASKASTGQMLD